MNALKGSRTAKVFAGIALISASAIVIAGCSSTPSSESGGSDKPAADLTLKLGSLLPQTGSLAFLGPPMESGVGLAVQEVNDAAAGVTIDLTAEDEGDTDTKAYETSITKLQGAGVSAIVGAAASGVSKLILDGNVSAGILQISASNTSPDFTTWDDNGLYFRTAPSDLLQGEVLGNLIAEDGAKTLGIIYQNDAYGTGLNDAITKTFESTGGEVVESVSFNVGDAQFDAQVESIKAQNPDAVAIVSFDQFKTIAPLLVNAGISADKFYMVDGNLSDYGTEIPVSLEGAQGTKAGPALADDFTSRLQDYWTGEGNPRSRTSPTRLRRTTPSSSWLWRRWRRAPPRARTSRPRCRRSRAVPATARSAPASPSAPRSSTTAARPTTTATPATSRSMRPATRRAHRSASTSTVPTT